jgi:hypothetical protein
MSNRNMDAIEQSRIEAQRAQELQVLGKRNAERLWKVVDEFTRLHNAVNSIDDVSPYVDDLDELFSDCDELLADLEIQEDENGESDELTVILDRLENILYEVEALQDWDELPPGAKHSEDFR